MSPDSPDAPTDAESARSVRADVTTTATAAGVLVAVTLRNDTAVDVRVHVENDLDGPVLAPRREGVPEDGWDESGFTGVVPANARLGIGYACPSADSGTGDRAPEDPDSGSGSAPISLEVLGPAGEADDPSGADRVAAAVRSLGRATPPADAVPTSPTVDIDGPTADRRSHCRGSVGSEVPDVPPSIASWLDAIETRVRRAERLTDATADEAASVLEDCGGVDGVATLPDDLEGDLASLRAVGDRIEELTARAAAPDPGPVVSSLAAAADGNSSVAAGDGKSVTPGANDTANPDSGGTQ